MHDIILKIIKEILSLEFILFCWVMSILIHYNKKYPEEASLIRYYFRNLFMTGCSIVALLYTLFELFLKHT